MKWDAYVHDQELVEVGKWVDELADDSGNKPEDVASIVIDESVHFINPAMFDEIVDYVEARRKFREQDATNERMLRRLGR
jgi:hypothetical protein